MPIYLCIKLKPIVLTEVTLILHTMMSVLTRNKDSYPPYQVFAVDAVMQLSINTCLTSFKDSPGNPMDFYRCAQVVS